MNLSFCDNCCLRVEEEHRDWRYLSRDLGGARFWAAELCPECRAALEAMDFPELAARRGLFAGPATVAAAPRVLRPR